MNSTNYTNSADWTISIKYDGSNVFSTDLFTFANTYGDNVYFFAEETGNYTVVIEAAGDNVSTNIPFFYKSNIIPYKEYWWYNGAQLSIAISDDIYKLKVTEGSNTYYSDWIDACGFDDKVKIKVSSAVDYGGVKYVLGYAQWCYKDASVRRSPRANIEITAEQRNGKRIDEKKVSAVRYVLRVKITESEYDAFVHAAAGDLEITDPEGKTYDCTGVEITDPQWFRGNAILEITFNDENNISVWTLNNSAI